MKKPVPSIPTVKNIADKILKNEYQVDSVLNLTWILSETNRNIISDDLPSVYLNKIMTQYGGANTGRQKIIDVMRDHAINEDALNALLEDDYFKFIEERKTEGPIAIGVDWDKELTNIRKKVYL